LDKKTSSLLKGYMQKASEKLRAAETLFKAQEYDDAVSRAYYSAYHAAQAVLLTEELAASTHRGLVNLFGLHFVKTGKFDKKFGKFLANLKDDRERSDYEIYSTIDKEEALQAIKEAQQFSSEVRSYLKKYIG